MSIYTCAGAGRRLPLRMITPRNQAAIQLTVKYEPPAPRFISWTILRAHFQMTLAVEPGVAYVVEASADMKTWENYFTSVATSNTMIVSSGLSSAEHKFFRARVVTP